MKEYQLFIAPGMEVKVIENPVLPPNTVAFVTKCPGGWFGCDKCRRLIPGKHISLIDLNEEEDV